MSTPSRVTRSASRQPERVASSGAKSRGSTPARGASDSSKKKATATPASSKKRAAAATRAESPAAKPVRRQSSGGAKKAAASEAFIDSSLTNTNGNGESIADGLNRRGSSSRVSKRLSGASVEDVVSPSPSPSRATGTRQPLIALLPHILLFSTIIMIANFLVVYDFARPATQKAIIAFLNKFGNCSCLESALAKADQYDIAFWAVAPLYLLAGGLLRWGTALVAGPSNRTAVFAYNLTRTFAAVVMLETIYALKYFDTLFTYEGMNALWVIRFAIVFQEFLINFKQFSPARQLYSLIFLAVSGYFTYAAYTLEKSETPATVPIPAVIVAIDYATVISALSINFGAFGAVFNYIGCGFMGVVFLALQSIINFAVVPIFAFALYSRQPTLFQAASEPSSFLESTGASLLLVVLIFLVFLDSYVPKTFNADVVEKKTKRS